MVSDGRGEMYKETIKEFGKLVERYQEGDVEVSIFAKYEESAYDYGGIFTKDSGVSDLITTRAVLLNKENNTLSIHHESAHSKSYYEKKNWYSKKVYGSLQEAAQSDLERVKERVSVYLLNRAEVKARDERSAKITEGLYESLKGLEKNIEEKVKK